MWLLGTIRELLYIPFILVPQEFQHSFTHACLPLRSGGPKLRQSEQYPKGFGRTLAIRHIFGKEMGWVFGFGGMELDGNGNRNS